MSEREMSVFIAAPPAAVFDYISDVSRHPEWAQHPLEIQHKSGPTRGPGATFTSHSPAMGGVHGESMVETADSPRFVYRANDSSGQFRWTLLTEPDGAGTRLTYGMDVLQMPAVKRFIFGLVTPSVVKPGMKKTLDNLKQRVEAAAAKSV